MPPKKTIKKVSKVINFYELENVQKHCKKAHNPHYEEHHINVPFRMAIIGASGSKKTNTLMNILHIMNDTFQKIEIYCRCADEPLYNFLRETIPSDMLTIHEGLKELNRSDLNIKFGDKKATLIVFDDICLEKDQSKISELYIRGRKLNCSCIYISQKYFSIPVEVRGQLNYVIIKKISGKGDLKRVIGDSSLSLSVDEVFELYKYCIGQGSDDWLMIDLEAQMQNAYRHNYDVIPINEIFNN